MKKALTKVLLTAITLVIFAAIIPLSASASTNDNKSEVFQTLVNKLGLNPAAACGIMANIERESGFDPTVVVTDSNGLLSGGLCQWNGGRFSNLKTFCNNNGYSYLSIEGQMAYLKHEISSSYYNHIYSYLKSCPNTADGAYKAGWYWCYYFEIPSDRATKASQRGSNAQTKYWPEYGIEDLRAPKLSFSSKKNPYDIDNTVKFKWSDGGDDASNYYLHIAAKNSKGKYDWSKAKITKLGSNVTSKAIAPETFKKGSYAAYVYAYNSKTGKQVKSNSAKFTVKCLTHEKVAKVTTPATFDKEGVMTYTCKQCSAKSTKPIAKLTLDDFKTIKVSSFKVKSYTDSSVKLQWNALDGADGYKVYYREYVNGTSWKRASTIRDPEAKSFTVTELEKGVKYYFRIRAFRYNDAGKGVYTKYATISGATTPDAPILTNITQGSNNVKLNWVATENVYGYSVYVAEGQDSADYKLLKRIADPDATSYTASSFKKGQFYYFTVKSYIKTTNGYVYSPASEIFYIIGK